MSKQLDSKDINPWLDISLEAADNRSIPKVCTEAGAVQQLHKWSGWWDRLSLSRLQRLNFTPESRGSIQRLLEKPQEWVQEEWIWSFSCVRKSWTHWKRRWEGRIQLKSTWRVQWSYNEVKHEPKVHFHHKKKSNNILRFSRKIVTGKPEKILLHEMK